MNHFWIALAIAFNEEFEGTEPIEFAFIEESSERTIDGVMISENISFEED